MIGRALQTDFGVWLGSDMGKHGFAKAGFAETGLAGQQKELSLSGGSDGPAVQHERKFGVTADEGCRGGVASGVETAGVVMGGDHLPRPDFVAPVCGPWPEMPRFPI